MGFKCCICGKEIDKEWGNNSRPYKDKGECCDLCNLQYVVPARIKAMREGVKK